MCGEPKANITTPINQIVYVMHFCKRILFLFIFCIKTQNNFGANKNEEEFLISFVSVRKLSFEIIRSELSSIHVILFSHFNFVLFTNQIVKFYKTLAYSAINIAVNYCYCNLQFFFLSFSYGEWCLFGMS